MLTLPIRKKWFDMILSGEKKEEYREIKEYYETRFQNLFGAEQNKQYYILEILNVEKMAADKTILQKAGDS